MDNVPGNPGGIDDELGRTMDDVARAAGVVPDGTEGSDNAAVAAGTPVQPAPAPVTPQHPPAPIPQQGGQTAPGWGSAPAQPYGAAAPVYGAPQPAYGAPTQDPVLVTVGDIGVTRTSVVMPLGVRSLRGSVWMVQNNTTTTEAIPTYAIVLCVVFALFCLLGLLFLLIKERKTQGFMTVSVQGEGFYHATQIPISFPTQVSDVEGRVNYIRSLSAAA